MIQKSSLPDSETWGLQVINERAAQIQKHSGKLVHGVPYLAIRYIKCAFFSSASTSASSLARSSIYDPPLSWHPFFASTAFSRSSIAFPRFSTPHWMKEKKNSSQDALIAFSKSLCPFLTLLCWKRSRSCTPSHLSMPPISTWETEWGTYGETAVIIGIWNVFLNTRLFKGPLYSPRICNDIDIKTARELMPAWTVLTLFLG